MPQPLKILMVNWKWYPVAGDWTYVDNLKNLYEGYGHNVIPFSTKSSQNNDTKGFDKYFIDYTDFRELNKRKTVSNSLTAISKCIYSREAKKKLGELLSQNSVQIAHLHDINHYITPSILPLLKKNKIPIIWTLHDYTLICPESYFVSNGKICENCRGGKFYHCVLQKCKKKSFLASSLAALENTIHTYLNVFKNVNYFLCPSEFLYKKFMEFGFHPDKLILTNLCCEIPMPIKNKSEKYLLFSGRLSKIKGILTLLKAVKDLDIKLYIAGEGDDADSIKDYIVDKKMINVILLGFKSKSEIYSLIRNAEFIVCPSEWYENFPFVIIEAMLLKTPVIASNIGGIPELVIHGETGLLTQAFNYLDLREKILILLNNPAFGKVLAEKAHSRTQSIVNYKNHYEVLKSVYSKLGLEL